MSEVVNFQLAKLRRNYDAFYDRVVGHLDTVHANSVTLDLECAATLLGLNASACHVLVKSYDSDLCTTPEYGYLFHTRLSIPFYCRGELITADSPRVNAPDRFEWVDHRNAPHQFGIAGWDSTPFLECTVSPLGTRTVPTVVELSIDSWIESIGDALSLQELYLGLNGMADQLDHLTPQYEFVTNQHVNAYVRGTLGDYVIEITCHPHVLLNNTDKLLAMGGLTEC